MFALESMLAETVTTETQQIARGLRERDIALLHALVEQYQYRLVRYLIYFTGRRDQVDDLVQAGYAGTALLLLVRQRALWSAGERNRTTGTGRDRLRVRAWRTLPSAARAVLQSQRLRARMNPCP